jgi:uncharacterized protein YegP (UPF0339 family)
MTKDAFVREVEIFETPAGSFFRLRAYNGKIVAQSEKYERSNDRTETAGKLAKQLGVAVTKGNP